MSFSDSNEIFYEVLERAAEAVSEKPKGDWTCFIRLYLGKQILQPVAKYVLYHGVDTANPRISYVIELTSNS